MNLMINRDLLLKLRYPIERNNLAKNPTATTGKTFRPILHFFHDSPDHTEWAKYEYKG